MIVTLKYFKKNPNPILSSFIVVIDIHALTPPPHFGQQVSNHCDPIGRFIGLWATFQSLWQQSICPNLPLSWVRKFW